MIAFPGMLLNAAVAANMKTPSREEFDEENLDQYKEEYPHLYVFLLMQLGRPQPVMGCHWENAEIVASLTDEEVKAATPEML